MQHGRENQRKDFPKDVDRFEFHSTFLNETKRHPRKPGRGPTRFRSDPLSPDAASAGPDQFQRRRLAIP